MSRKTLKQMQFLMLVIAPILSGCARDRLPSLSWHPWRDKGFAYAPPSGLPPSAEATASVSAPQVAANTAAGPPMSVTGSPAPDPYAAGADQTIAESGRASSSLESSDSGYPPRGRSSCSSGCCSR